MSKDVEVVLVEVTDENKDTLVRLAMSMYLNETCPYCLKVFDTMESLKGSVWNGYTKYGRIAHTDCWHKVHDDEAQP